MIGAGGGRGCPFCEVPLQSNENVLRTTFHGTVLKPFNPVTPGHVLLIPKIHLDPRIPTHLALGMQYVSEILQAFAGFGELPEYEEDKTGEFNLILNAGHYASQSVEHMHWHFVPRREIDGLVLPWTYQATEA